MVKTISFKSKFKIAVKGYMLQGYKVIRLQGYKVTGSQGLKNLEK
jgi:hypothetical protein